VEEGEDGGCWGGKAGEEEGEVEGGAGEERVEGVYYDEAGRRRVACGVFEVGFKLGDGLSGAEEEVVYAGGTA
jgi:hypothetical protein